MAIGVFNKNWLKADLRARAAVCSFFRFFSHMASETEGHWPAAAAAAAPRNQEIKTKWRAHGRVLLSRLLMVLQVPQALNKEVAIELRRNARSSLVVAVTAAVAITIAPLHHGIVASSAYALPRCGSTLARPGQRFPHGRNLRHWDALQR